ncbi:aminotransferase class V-fold PLP-dependent enzyme [Pseudoalteromonas sp. BZB3]|uniref:aminotransferase class V-fold PLP-dependent enzyme n=1 Tax=Pseudoalteromonas sp. BZB3 TaxID=3136670 RepID=UPI0032C409E1
MKQDFVLPSEAYLLNHSVGRPLKSAETHFKQSYLSPWQDSGREPWQAWLAIITEFQQALGRLFNSSSMQFCPQVNLSSGLTKLIMALPELNENSVVLMSAQDFPSMGFAMQKALPDGAIIRYIPEHKDITKIDVWQQHLTADVDLVFVSQAYSNTGQLAPVNDIVKLAKANHTLSIIDVAQSAGIIPLNLTDLDADFMIGSSVKWLCGGPGAAYLWLNSKHIERLAPKDVGWFSHENPFEFDIHHFAYHDSALKFWGGTPSVAPFAFASHSIDYFSKLGDKLRKHNQDLIDLLIQHLGEQVVSPHDRNHRSGTVIINPKMGVETALTECAKDGISIDARAHGLRVSPHIYNDESDILKLLAVLK